MRIVDGAANVRRRLKLMSTNLAIEPLEVGVFRPALDPVAELSTGEVGYVATGLKNVKDCRVGDTLTRPRTARGDRASRIPARKADGIRRHLPFGRE